MDGAAGHRVAPPTGTITFLFTDIEGSTQLVLSLGAAAWTPLLQRHRDLLRAAIRPEGGVEIQTEGDAIFAVFASAPAAVAAVAAAQRALHAEPWPAATPIRVRMGLHSGEGLLDPDGSYVGPDVHRAARVASAAHGGQVLLSDTTRALVAHALPAGVALVELGEHRLKDLRPERLFQLRIDGVPAAFPPIRSLDLRRNNLPTQLTSFVGRDRELAEAAALLAGTRLLTLTGPGGTGKTRLSLQLAAAVADRFPDGVWFVPLEPVRDPALVAPTIARTLGIGLGGAQPALEAIAATIAGKRVLMVLDNFEQVTAAAPVAAELLRACPELRLVVTSRAVLRVSGEQEYQVPGLPAPPDTSRLPQIERENLPEALRHPGVAELSQYEAVRLFIARASAVRPGFAVTNDNAPAVAQICARLGGMPLAIELAAARVKLLSPAQILARLESQLALLVSGARDLPERQQTLRGAIAWSYELLDPATADLLCRLSVFSGGWDIEAAEGLCTAGAPLAIDMLEGLAALADQSLVRQFEAAGEVRFDMFPTIREFAREKLAAAGLAGRVFAWHAGHFLALAEAAAPQLQGADQRRWLDRLEREHDNLRAALDWAVARPEPEMAVRLAFALWRFWQQRGYLNEGRARLEAIAGKGWPLSDLMTARLHEALGGVAYWQVDRPATVAAYDAALAAWRRLGDRREIANALYNRSYAEILQLLAGGTVIPPEAQALGMAYCEEALALVRAEGDRAGEGNLLWALGSFHYFANQPDAAAGLYAEALAIFRGLGQRTMEAWTLHMAAMTALRRGDVAGCRAWAREALAIFHAAGDLPGVSMVLEDLAAVAIADGELERAGRLHGGAKALQTTTGATLSTYVESEFELRLRPTVRSTLRPDDLARLAAEGAALPLDAIVALALQG